MTPLYQQKIDNHQVGVWPQSMGASSDFRDNCLANGSCYKIMPFPTPVELNTQLALWDDEENVKRDCCAITMNEKQSQRPGYYQLSGYDPHCLSDSGYANKLNEPTHFPKEYRNNFCFTPEENALIFSQLTNKNQINQLFTRPYLGSYKGAGARSEGEGLKDLESFLMQGIMTNSRDGPCEPYKGEPAMRYSHLPDFGNAQQWNRVQLPGADLGGISFDGRAPLNTRETMQRVDYARRCKFKDAGVRGILKPYIQGVPIQTPYNSKLAH